ncbi:MAG: 4Fe-4S double cluster binding domain-containing protein [Oscillospiraceae bacterium]
MELYIRNEIENLCKNNGLLAPGFFIQSDEPKVKYGISIAVPLSNAVVDEILENGSPTHSYFHHYRTANAYLDSCMLSIGLLLQNNGFKYIPIGASQSIRTKESPNGFHGRFSHKKGAYLSGLGFIGTNGLFIHKENGPRVRLGTILTDCCLAEDNPKLIENTICQNCKKCVKICPANAILGNIYHLGDEDFSLIDPMACSNFMKKEYQLIGRGSVCGLCMAVCPMGKLKK